MATPSASTAAAELSDEDRTAAAAVPQRIISAWMQQDPDGFADVFTDDATMILPGVLCQGREEIRTFMRAAFAGPYRGSQVTGAPLSMRVLNPTTTVVVTQGGVLMAGETELATERAIRATWVVVKEQGRWSLAAYQNSPLHRPAPAS